MQCAQLRSTGWPVLMELKALVFDPVRPFDLTLQVHLHPTVVRRDMACLAHSSVLLLPPSQPRLGQLLSTPSICQGFIHGEDCHGTFALSLPLRACSAHVFSTLSLPSTTLWARCVLALLFAPITKAGLVIILKKLLSSKRL
ncbi:hypothetical protein AB1Y20_015593 [Prymnesium parvum]|uniref:Uncharacterized protein n=1 Tax=Prymnesium parvum TaxID=97485 RepID=A0AB34K100_PRYPA|mmetsp:Transcript_7820/g.17257  ORF Transcript_7820/g.17257 Transcript_7820/m.17257 type:complete len:142 (-) Transcript_7820:193-618(-)